MGGRASQPADERDEWRSALRDLRQLIDAHKSCGPLEPQDARFFHDKLVAIQEGLLDWVTEGGSEDGEGGSTNGDAEENNNNESDGSSQRHALD